MISETELRAAGAAIRAGELVAFPTETVYGLGANALDAAAVKRIFEAKGRPASSPLIVHVESVEQARTLAAEWPEAAQLLAEKFWPGPLTLVLQKRAIVPDEVTAGLDSVGLRMPDNPIALALIRQADVPVAAPSANRFTGLSPTRPEHVRASLGDRVDIVLEGGSTNIGIESAVVSLRGGVAELLRPGTITRDEIEAVIGPVSTPRVIKEAGHRAPGQHARHYQPRTPLVLVENGCLPKDGSGALLALSGIESTTYPQVQMPHDARKYARRLYEVLHEMDARGLDWIAVEPVPCGVEWDGVRDRLTRAAHR